MDTQIHVRLTWWKSFFYNIQQSVSDEIYIICWNCQPNAFQTSTNNNLNNRLRILLIKFASEQKANLLYWSCYVANKYDVTKKPIPGIVTELSVVAMLLVTSLTCQVYLFSLHLIFLLFYISPIFSCFLLFLALSTLLVPIPQFITSFLFPRKNIFLFVKIK